LLNVDAVRDHTPVGGDSMLLAALVLVVRHANDDVSPARAIPLPRHGQRTRRASECVE